MDQENQRIEHVSFSREAILDELKRRGFRLTEQRKIIVDIIVNEEYSCCKEVYCMAHKKDPSIGIATVYRMVNLLEELGAISRNNIQKASCSGRCCDMKGGCTVVADESKRIILSKDDIQEALKYIINKNGYESVEEIKAILIDQDK